MVLCGPIAYILTQISMNFDPRDSFYQFGDTERGASQDSFLDGTRKSMITMPSFKSFCVASAPILPSYGQSTQAGTPNEVVHVLILVLLPWWSKYS